MSVIMRSYTAATAALLLAAVGCGDSQAGDAAGITVDTLANGTVHVVSPATGLWSGEEGWRLVPEIRIGSAMAEGPDLFGQIAGIALDRLGRIYVGDSRARDVRVFNADGTHLRTLGRDGSGPGEFRQIQGMGWGPDRNLWVVDGQNGFVVYDTTGVFVRTRPRNTSFSIYPWPGRFDSRGGVTDVGGGNVDGEFRRLLIRSAENFTQVDTVPFPSFELEQYELRYPNGNLRMTVGVPFAPDLAIHIDHEGYLWSGITDRYRLHRESPEGDTVRIVEREFTPLPVATSDRAEAMENLQFFIEEGGVVDPSRVPATKPAFVSMFTDDDGYLWVKPWIADDAANPHAVDVFDPDGRYLGRVSSDVQIAPTPAPVVIGDQLLAVVRDELDVPIVARFRIEGRD